jgi:hypothetical protein
MIDETSENREGAEQQAVSRVERFKLSKSQQLL